MFAQVLEMLGWEKNKHFYCGFRTIGSQDYYYAKVIQQKFDSTLSLPYYYADSYLFLLLLTNVMFLCCHHISLADAAQRAEAAVVQGVRCRQHLSSASHSLEEIPRWEIRSRLMSHNAYCSRTPTEKQDT